jgi:hypothetical protein
MNYPGMNPAGHLSGYTGFDGTDCTMEERKSDAEAARQACFTPFAFPPHPPIPQPTVEKRMTGNLKSK